MAGVSEEIKYRRITIDFESYNEDLSKQYEKGRKEARFDFIKDFKNLLEGPGGGENFAAEVLDFLNENEIQGAHREFLNKIIIVSVPGLLGLARKG